MNIYYIRTNPFMYHQSFAYYVVAQNEEDAIRHVNRLQVTLYKYKTDDLIITALTSFRTACFMDTKIDVTPV